MKSFLVASSMFIISLASFFTDETVSVNFDIPQSVKPGSSFIVSVDISKGDLSTYAKMQLDLPEGFTIELLEGEGGTFTFFDQKMKLIWIALPPKEDFQVKLKVNTTESLTGKHKFTGKFSFVNNGERNSIELVTPEILMDENASTLPPITTIDKPDNSEVDATASVESTSNENISTTSNVPSINVKRSFNVQQVQPGEAFTVELTIEKNMISGVGKIIEELPDGFTAVSLESNGSIFSQSGNQVKFLWGVLPAEDKFSVSYKVTVGDDVSGNKVIDGNFSYLEGADTKKHLIASTSIAVTNGDVVAVADVSSSNDEEEASNDSTVENETETVTETNSTASTSTNTDNVAEETEAVSDTEQSMDNEETATDATEVDAANDTHSVNYRVQICALRKKKNTDYFVKNHAVNEKIYLNMHEGWHKYTVGDFKAYVEARDHREVVKSKNKIVGPFVTAYNNGARITVQEALMITKDKWVQ